MKILHTSDWHLGHSLYEHDREEEQKNVMKQIINVVEQEQPDALLISGDVFDKNTPHNAAQKLYQNTLLEAHDKAPNMKIIITAGNHDSKSMLEIYKELWTRENVVVVGQLEYDEQKQPNYQRHIIPITDKDKKTIGYVIAVPHIYERNFPAVVGDEDEQNRQRAFFQHLIDLTNEQNTQHLPVVMMAHLTVCNADLTGHDNAQVIGTLEAVAREDLGEGYNYLALGHIHRPQNFVSDNNCIARYCGSPLAMSFDEQFTHSVSLVTFDSENHANIEDVPLVNPKPLLTIPVEPSLLKEALEEVAALPDEQCGYLRLNLLRNDAETLLINEKIEAVLKNKKIKFCTCKFTSSKPAAEKETPQNNISFQQRDELTPQLVAKLYLERKNLEEKDIETFMDMLNTAIEECKLKEEQNN